MTAARYDVLGLGNAIVDVITRTEHAETVGQQGEIIKRELQFIEAAEALGASSRRVIVVHLLPNLLSPLLVQGTFVFAFSILTEAALSFLGAGVPPTSATWGNMIATAQEYMQNADWLILAPGLCIVLTVLSLQAVGDGLRDALDPRLRRLT